MQVLINRRSLMKRLAGAAMLPMVVRTMAAEAAAASNAILVVIDMQGGNDGLNTIVPITTAQFGAYAALRPHIGLSSSVLAPMTFNQTYGKIGQGSQFAFNPAMGLNYLAPGATPTALTNSLPQLYQEGRLAIIAGVGLPSNDSQRTNHACAQQDWYAGVPNAWAGTSNGWLGLALDGASAGKLGPTASMNGSTLMIQGKTHGGLVLGSLLSSFAPAYPSNTKEPLLYAQWLSTPASGGAALKFANSLASVTETAAANVATINTATSVADYPWMNSSAKDLLEVQLSSVAQLIIGGSGIRGYVTSREGFDTHDNQTADASLRCSPWSAGRWQISTPI